MTYQEFQRGLIALGYDLGRAGADGIPGRMTQRAIIAFKSSIGLTPTVTIGPKTIEGLNKALAARNKPPAGRTPPPPSWVIEAGRYLGVAEVAGPRSNPTILGWAQRLGAKALGIKYTDDDTPWCGLFVAAVIATTLPNEALPAIVVRASSWDKFGRALGAPALGAIARFQRPGGGHVGFVVGISADGRLLRIRGGNQSNRVSDAWIETARVVAYRWPSSIVSSPAPAPVMDSRGVTISRNES